MKQSQWVRLYAALVAALPSSFRVRNGTELREIFEMRWEAGRGWRRHSWALRECLDVAALGVRLRFSRSTRHERMGRERGHSLELLGQEAWQVGRGLMRAPGFALSVVATLGLGIGAMAAVFSLAYGLWLKPLPYDDPGTLVSIRQSFNGMGATVAAPEVADLARAPSLAGLAAYHYGAVITDEGGEPRRLVAYGVTPSLFSLLGVRPELGRGFVAEDVTGDGARPVVLSDRIWRERFGADRGIIGRTVSLRGGGATVVGVMPREFAFPLHLPSEVWFPFDPATRGSERFARTMLTVGRLRAGSTLTQLEAELATISAGLAEHYPESSRGWVARATPVVEETVRSYRSALSLLLAMVGLLVAIASANIASLFIVRHMGREQELMVRAALGAGAWRLRRMVLTESIVLALVAGAVGIGVAHVVSAGLGAILPAHMPRVQQLQLGAPVIGFAMGISLMLGIGCGFASSGSGAQTRLALVLRGAGRSVHGAPRQRLRSTLVIAEVALSLVLLAAAGLMGRAFVDLLHADRGFEPAGLLTMHVSVPFERYRDDETRALLFDQLTERIESVPGVARAAAVTGYPGSTMGILGGGPLSVEGRSESTNATLRAAGPGYFQTMLTPIREGRDFSTADRTGAPPVAIINEMLARALFPGRSAVGRTLRLPAAMTTNGEPGPPVEIVGVAGNMLTRAAAPEIFLPTAQRTAYWNDVVVRTTVKPGSVTGAVERALREIEPLLLIEGVDPMTAVLNDWLALERTQSLLAVLFSALATLLCAVGVYGLLAHLVNQRMQEIGVRRALGAQRAHIIRDVVGRGMSLCVAGLATGTLVAVTLHRVIAGRLSGLGELRPAVLAAAAVLLLVIAAAACWIPARRALRVDPLSALR